ncbi:hypothetical protein HY612_00135 [Candidatus Roizmanbacteria bacterium]|nr:hypothetical protein [Candidatus Roizmanbacteria bacterium]
MALTELPQFSELNQLIVSFSIFAPVIALSIRPLRKPALTKGQIQNSSQNELRRLARDRWVPEAERAEGEYDWFCFSHLSDGRYKDIYPTNQPDLKTYHDQYENAEVGLRH